MSVAIVNTIAYAAKAVTYTRSQYMQRKSGYIHSFSIHATIDYVNYIAHCFYTSCIVVHCCSVQLGLYRS